MRLKTSLRVSAAAVLALSLMLTASAQQPAAPQTTNDNGDTVITVNTQLVVETVTVTDKSGKSIEGLTAKDFTVTEDNVPADHQILRIPEAPRRPRASAARPRTTLRF